MLTIASLALPPAISLTHIHTSTHTNRHAHIHTHTHAVQQCWKVEIKNLQHRTEDGLSVLHRFPSDNLLSFSWRKHLLWGFLGRVRVSPVSWLCRSLWETRGGWSLEVSHWPESMSAAPPEREGDSQRRALGAYALKLATIDPTQSFNVLKWKI